jgi:hypothetical protein
VNPRGFLAARGDLASGSCLFSARVFPLSMVRSFATITYGGKIPLWFEGGEGRCRGTSGRGGIFSWAEAELLGTLSRVFVE